MAIVRMKKLTLASPLDERDEILEFIQAKGCVHLIDLKTEFQDFEGVEYFKEASTVSEAEITYNHIKAVYDFLKPYNLKKKSMFLKRESISRKEFDELDEMINWQNVYIQAREIEDSITSAKNSKTKAHTLIEQYKNFEHFDVSDNELMQLKNAAYFLGSLSKKYESPVYDELTSKFQDLHIEKLHEGNQDITLFILSHKKEENRIFDILKKYGFVKSNLSFERRPSDKLNELYDEISKLDKQMDELKNRAAKLAKDMKDIEKIYDYIYVKLKKERAVSKLVKTNKAFILKGWVPETESEEFKEEFTKSFKEVFLNIEDPSEEDVPPVALKNNMLAEPFEVVTTMYSLPRPDKVDPTPVLTPFFMVFFGMMLADMGYGLIMFIVTTLGLRFMDFSGNTKKLVKLLQYVSIPTIIFGWLYGSFFGGIIKIKPLWLDPVANPMNVLTVAIAMGIIHLYIGLGVKAYQYIRGGKILDAIYDVFFWYDLVSGLIWMLLGGGTFSKVIAIIGAAGLVLTQGRENKSLSGKLFGGLYGLYGITGYLGDALSYSRLLALGLASGLIGWSFNLLIGLLGGGIVQIIVGPIIFILGHTFNFLISSLGTFVHTARLQYLEFFGKFYEGGGKAFEPLKINTRFIKVKTEK